VEGLGFDLLMVSDHIVVTPDVAEQVVEDLERLRADGAHAVVLDPFVGDPEETRRPDVALDALTAVRKEFR
jgi:predicted nicotinamide N-methyase